MSLFIHFHFELRMLKHEIFSVINIDKNNLYTN